MRNPPSPSRGDDHTEQQAPGFVHRPLKRHCFVGNGDSALERFFVQSGIGSFEKARHCRTPLKTEHSADIEIELAISNSRWLHRTASRLPDTTNALPEQSTHRIARSFRPPRVIGMWQSFSENPTFEDLAQKPPAQRSKFLELLEHQQNHDLAILIVY